MVKANSKFLKRNAIRVNKRAGVKECFDKVRLMEGSELALRHHVEIARVQGYDKLMNRLADAYNVSIAEVIDILTRMATFNKAQRSVLLKLVHGEPLSLQNNEAKSGKSSKNNSKSD